MIYITLQTKKLNLLKGYSYNIINIIFLQLGYKID